MADKMLTATSERGALFACVDPAARFVEPQVADRRLTAALHPFSDEAAALAALIAAGGVPAERARNG